MTKDVEPTLNDILKIIFAAREYLLISFLNKIANVNNLPVLKDRNAKLDSELNLIFSFPEVAAVLRCLELKQYKSLKSHNSGFISEQINVPQLKVDGLLKELLEAKRISFSKGKYHSPSHGVDTTGEYQGGIYLAQYWLERALEFSKSSKKPSKNSVFSHLVFSISDLGRKKIFRLYYQFYDHFKQW